MRFAPENDSLTRTLTLILLALALAGAILLRTHPTFVLRLAHCPLREITGLPCFTCGGTHAALALAHLRIAAALRQNPLVAAAGLSLGVWALYAIAATLVPRWRRRIVLDRREAKVLGVIVVVLLVSTWIYEINRLG